MDTENPEYDPINEHPDPAISGEPVPLEAPEIQPTFETDAEMEELRQQANPPAPEGNPVYSAAKEAYEAPPTPEPEKLTPEQARLTKRHELTQASIKALRFQHQLPADNSVVLRRFGKMDDAKDELASKLLDILTYQCRSNAVACTEITALMNHTVLARCLQGKVGLPPSEYGQVILENALAGITNCLNTLQEKAQLADQLSKQLQNTYNRVSELVKINEQKEAELKRLRGLEKIDETWKEMPGPRPAALEHSHGKASDDDSGPARDLTGVL